MLPGAFPELPLEERFIDIKPELRDLFVIARLLAAVTTAEVAVAKLRICFEVFAVIFAPTSSFTSENSSFGVSFVF